LGDKKEKEQKEKKREDVLCVEDLVGRID